MLRVIIKLLFSAKTPSILFIVSCSCSVGFLEAPLKKVYLNNPI